MQDSDIVLYQRSHYKPLIDRAITITEKYVSDHKLILTGGMAIDLALRAKGESIYDDDALPDYDIISAKNLHHANALAEILCKDGLPDINVINAFHVTTVRVRMKNIVFLDATYIPPDCFDRIPYLDVDHLRVVHPHYQFIDQRLSLSHLLMDTGRSLNIFNRLKKDISRNELLRQMYPISATRKKSLPLRRVRVPIQLIAIDRSDLNQLDKDAFVYTGPTCIAGYVGMLLLMNPKKCKLTDDALEIDIPSGIPARMLCCDIGRVKKYIKNPITSRPIINIKPITQLAGDLEFVDTYGARVGCNVIKLSDSVSVCVASVDYILMELLRDRIYVSEEPFSSLYHDLISKVDQMRSQDSDLLWWPSVNCYGVDNFPEAKILMLERMMYPESANTLKPRNSYPFAPKCATRSQFTPEDSHYFQIDGNADKKLKHTSYKYILDDFKQFVDKKRNETKSTSASRNGGALNFGLLDEEYWL
jgi:hypothetical protein